MSDTTDDVEMWAGAYEEEIEYREAQWAKGIHKDQNGKKYNLKDMETSHLENCIRYFDDHDTSPLEQELKRRNEIKR